MIFKFDKGGNMENIVTEGDNDMGRKSNKDRFNQMDVDVVNQVKEEVLGMVNETSSQVAVGYQEAMDENDEDMVQKEMELVKEMENENDKIWDKGSRDGVVGDSVGDDENEKSVMSDEELKQKMRERNMGNVGGSGDKPVFGSLSNKAKMEDSGGQAKEEESNEENSEKQRKKDELAKKREANKLKKELKLMDSKLKESTNWSFSPVIPCYRQGEITKYNCVISAYDLATMWEHSIKYINSIQRGSKLTSSGQEKDNFSPKHVTEIFQAFTQNKIFGNTIVLNYSLDNDSELVYDPDTSTISGEGYLQAVDCSHRARAALKWKSVWVKHPDQYDDPRQYQFTCEVNNVSDDDARQMFAEYNNYSLKVNPTRTSYLDNTNYPNKIARRIEKESDWKNKIETVSTTIKSSSPNICTFGVLTNAIKRSYKEPQTKLEQKNLEDWLIEYIDELVSIFPQFMVNSNLEARNNLKKLYFTIEPLSIGAMIALSAVLKDDPDWKIKLGKLTQDDFFLRTASRWRPVLKEGGKIINGTSSVKYFNETVINWCAK